MVGTGQSMTISPTCRAMCGRGGGPSTYAGSMDGSRGFRRCSEQFDTIMAPSSWTAWMVAPHPQVHKPIHIPATPLERLCTPAPDRRVPLTIYRTLDRLVFV